MSYDPGDANTVIVSIPGSEFTAHRNVLSFASPLLKEMLTDAGGDERLKVELEGVTPAAFDVLRGYITAGCTKLNCQNVTDVYRCAYKLKIRPIVTRCLQYLAEAGPVGRHIVLYANATELGLQDDQQAAFEFIVEHFDKAIRSRQFLELPWEPVTTLLRSDRLATPNEASVFVAALAWLQQDYAARRTREDAVLACVRYGLFSEDMLLRCFDPPMARPALKNRFVRTRLVEAAFYHYARLRGRPELAEEFKPRPREFVKATEAPITWTSDGKVENFEAESYTRAHQLRRQETVRRILDAVNKHKESRSAAHAAAEAEAEDPGVRRYYKAHEHQVMVAQTAIRGFLARRDYGALHAPVQPPAILEDLAEEEFTVRHPGSLDVAPATWTMFPAQKLAKHAGPLSGTDNPVILLAGGIEPSKSYEMGTGCALLLFDPRTGLLTRCGRLPQPRHNHAAVVLGGYFYVLGGFDTRNTHRGLKFATSSCFRMNITTCKWERIADMRYARCSHTALADEGRIYVIAGQDEFDTFLGSVEVYSPETNSWHEIGPPLPCRLSAPGAAVFGGSVLVAGGMVQSQRRSDRVFVSSAIHRWEQKLGRWVAGPSPLPSGRGSFSLVEHNGRLYAIGGLVRAVDEISLEVVPDVLVLEKGSWVQTCPLPRPLHGCQASSLPNGPLFVIGGLSTATLVAPSDVIWSFDGKSWIKVANLPAAIVGFATAVLPAGTQASS